MRSLYDAAGMLALGIAVFVGSNSAAAEPIAVRVVGECPTAEAVIAELERAQGTAVEEPADAAAGWALYVEQTPAGVDVTLREPTGRLVAQREIKSDDCDALGRATALIVVASLESARTTTAPVDEPPEPQPSPPPSATVAPNAGVQWSLGLAGGAQVSASPRLVAGAGQLDTTLAGRRLPIDGRLVGQASSPTHQRVGAERVRLIQTAVRADLFYRWASGRSRIQAGAGAGILVTHATAMSAPSQPSRVMVRPVFAIPLTAAVRLGDRVRLRGEFVASVAPWTNGYVVEPAGVVARSPIFTAQFLVGIEFDLVK